MSNSGSIPPKLDPKTLYAEQEKRDTLRLKTYNNILEQVHTKIKTIARIPHNDKSLLFVVPEFVIGVPRFLTRDCILFLAWHLRNSDFDVEYIHPNLLNISWKKHENQYREERNPIVKTMTTLVSPPVTPIIKPVAKPVVKKTTHQYLPGQNSADSIKHVTFI